MPQISLLSVMEPETIPDGETGELVETGEMVERTRSAPWNEATQLMVKGAKLLKLGVDAIVGQDLAQYWQTIEEMPPEYFRLSTHLAIIPGSTRTITKQEEAAVMKQLLLEVLRPLYEALGRVDLDVKFSEYIARLSGVDNVSDFMPGDTEVQQTMQQQQEAQQAEQQAQQQQMQAEQQSKDADLQREQTKGEIEIAKAQQGLEIDREKAKLQLATAAKSSER